jgi:hypothetical protein
MEGAMATYTFSLGNATDTRQAGIIETQSFDEALKLVGERMSVAQGDTLEIGVKGFPPARFQCVSTLFDGSVFWQPAVSELAA